MAHVGGDLKPAGRARARSIVEEREPRQLGEIRPGAELDEEQERLVERMIRSPRRRCEIRWVALHQFAANRARGRDDRHVRCQVAIRIGKKRNGRLRARD